MSDTLVVGDPKRIVRHATMGWRQLIHREQEGWSLVIKSPRYRLMNPLAVNPKKTNVRCPISKGAGAVSLLARARQFNHPFCILISPNHEVVRVTVASVTFLFLSNNVRTTGDILTMVGVRDIRNPIGKYARLSAQSCDLSLPGAVSAYSIVEIGSRHQGLSPQCLGRA